MHHFVLYVSVLFLLIDIDLIVLLGGHLLKYLCQVFTTLFSSIFSDGTCESTLSKKLVKYF